MSETQNQLNLEDVLIIVGYLSIFFFLFLNQYRYNLVGKLNIWLGLIGLCILDLFRSRTGIHPWKKVAASTHLKFIPGKTFDSAQITGIYQDKSVTLKVLHSVLCIKHTSISLEWPFSEDQILGDEEDINHILDLVNTRIPFKGILKIEQCGQKISYKQFGVEYDKEYLQLILYFLFDLADLYPKVIPIGGTAIKILQQVRVDDSSLIASQISPQLLQDIAIKTETQLKDQIANLLCVDCFVYCDVHKVNTEWGKTIVYYGCRACHQSQTFLEVPNGVIAVLDNEMKISYAESNDGLRVNWLIIRKPFDFCLVEIKQASDEDVERFAIHVGNDTDTKRKFLYSQTPCTVNCTLSPNTVRILQDLFETVEIR